MTENGGVCDFCAVANGSAGANVAFESTEGGSGG